MFDEWAFVTSGNPCRRTCLGGYMWDVQAAESDRSRKSRSRARASSLWMGRKSRWYLPDLDRSIALLGLLVLAPVLLVIAAAVKLSSPGPVLCLRERIGRAGRPFVMRKFRTMRVGADRQQAALAQENEHDGLMFKMRRDPRVTRVGHWLRRTSLDELPQLVNVLKGDMSLVGPRPPLAGEVAHYTPVEWRRLSVRPGLTGLWQINGRSDLSWDETVQLDLSYVDNWSFTSDVDVRSRTFRAVVDGRGAY